MKSLLFIIIPLVLLVFALIVFNYITTPKLEQGIIGYTYKFDNVHVTNDKVYIDCWLKVKNYSDSEVSFTVYTDLPAEKRRGILKDSTVYALNENMSKKVFTLGSQGSTRYGITFVGDYNGTLPENNHRVKLNKVHFELID